METNSVNKRLQNLIVVNVILIMFFIFILYSRKKSNPFSQSPHFAHFYSVSGTGLKPFAGRKVHN